MLALTPKATETIQMMLASPEMPAGAGLRITPPTDSMDGASATELSLAVVEAPGASDEVIVEHGARVFVDDALAGYLSDKLLDASIVGEQIQFLLGTQADDSA